MTDTWDEFEAFQLQLQYIYIYRRAILGKFLENYIADVEGQLPCAHKTSDGPPGAAERWNEFEVHLRGSRETRVP
jgi:hypothetical protein